MWKMHYVHSLTYVHNIMFICTVFCTQVENDVARREAVKGLESAVQELHTAFDTIRDELGSKAGVDKVEASLLDMAQMLKGATAQQVCTIIV
jgi:hypothetical protein